jgi:hypothetical protein
MSESAFFEARGRADLEAELERVYGYLADRHDVTFPWTVRMYEAVMSEQRRRLERAAKSERNLKRRIERLGRRCKALKALLVKAEEIAKLAAPPRGDIEDVD